MKNFKKQFVNLLTTTLLVLSSTSATALSITSAFEGNWYDPNKNGQGFYFERYQDAQGRTGLSAIFVTYADDGTAIFFTAGGLITKGMQTYPVFRPQIGTEISPGLFSPPIFTVVGKLELTFNSCNEVNAKVSFNPGVSTSPNSTNNVVPKIRVGTGSFSLRRLNGGSVQAKRCTGGVSDDTVGTDVPRVLDRTLLYTDFEIRTRFEQRPDASDLRLVFQFLPVGEYGIFLENVQLRQFRVVDAGGYTRGEARFRSPQLGSLTGFLDFDPVGAPLVLKGLSENLVQFQRAISLPTEGFRPLQLPPVLGVPSAAPLARESTLSAGQTLFARGTPSDDFAVRFKLESLGSNAEFRIASETLSVGNYQVIVNGTGKGVLKVIENEFNNPVGEMIFRSPTTAGTFPLDFSPLGARVQFIGDNGVEFEVMLNSL
jgi:hypothetical protein